MVTSLLCVKRRTQWGVTDFEMMLQLLHDDETLSSQNIHTTM